MTSICLIQEFSDDCSGIVNRLSQLKNEMQTDKPMRRVQDGRDDESEWNGLCDSVKDVTGTEPTWFGTSWLFAECYMYRRIQEAIALRF